MSDSQQLINELYKLIALLYEDACGKGEKTLDHSYKEVVISVLLHVVSILRSFQRVKLFLIGFLAAQLVLTFLLVIMFL